MEGKDRTMSFLFSDTNYVVSRNTAHEQTHAHGPHSTRLAHPPWSPCRDLRYHSRTDQP